MQLAGTKHPLRAARRGGPLGPHRRLPLGGGRADEPAARAARAAARVERDGAGRHPRQPARCLRPRLLSVAVTGA